MFDPFKREKTESNKPITGNDFKLLWGNLDKATEVIKEAQIDYKDGDAYFPADPECGGQPIWTECEDGYAKICAPICDPGFFLACVPDGYDPDVCPPGCISTSAPKVNPPSIEVCELVPDNLTEGNIEKIIDTGVDFIIQGGGDTLELVRCSYDHLTVYARWTMPNRIDGSRRRVGSSELISANLLAVVTNGLYGEIDFLTVDMTDGTTISDYESLILTDQLHCRASVLHNGFIYTPTLAQPDGETEYMYSFLKINILNAEFSWVQIENVDGGNELEHKNNSIHGYDMVKKDNICYASFPKFDGPDGQSNKGFVHRINLDTFEWTGQAFSGRAETDTPQTGVSNIGDFLGTGMHIFGKYLIAGTCVSKSITQTDQAYYGHVLVFDTETQTETKRVFPEGSRQRENGDLYGGYFAFRITSDKNYCYISCAKAGIGTVNEFIVFVYNTEMEWVGTFPEFGGGARLPSGTFWIQAIKGYLYMAESNDLNLKRCKIKDEAI